MRGMFTCGVMDVLLENDVQFDGSAGISAGAVFGCNYKSRQIGRPIRYNMKYCRDPRYCSIRSLIKTGDLYGADFCYHEVPERLDIFDTETFRNNSMKFYVGATDADTGKAVFHLCKDGGPEDIEWMRASASMPVLSRVVTIGSNNLLDGGMVCSVPFKFMESIGYDRNVIVLTQPKGYRKKKSSILPIIRLAMRRYPAMIHAMEVRHIVYNEQMEEIDEREASGRTLVVRPPEALGISRTENNPDELKRVYEIGRAEAERRLPDIQAFLTGKDN